MSFEETSVLNRTYPYARAGESARLEMSKEPGAQGIAGINPTDTEQDKDIKIGMAALTAAMLAAGAYALIFHRLPVGGPSSWAEFGDYFGGMVNPIVGIVTVLLVVRTLNTTRQEADLTRQQLQQQIAHSRLELLLSQMHQRLQGIHGEWLRLSSERAKHVVRVLEDRSLQSVPDPMTIEQLLNNATFAVDAGTVLSGRYSDNFRLAWNETYGPFSVLLREMGEYCEQYELTAKNPVLADYYRRRVLTPAVTLRRMGLLSDEDVNRLLPSNMRVVSAN